MGAHMEPRLSIVALGTRNLKKSKEFYRRLEWELSPASNEEIAFFQLGPVVLALHNWDDLAEDASVPADDSPGFRGFTLAHNVESPELVDETIDAAIEAGAQLIKNAQ